jgi:hypothetical protein
MEQAAFQTIFNFLQPEHFKYETHLKDCGRTQEDLFRTVQMYLAHTEK